MFKFSILISPDGSHTPLACLFYDRATDKAKIVSAHLLLKEDTTAKKSNNPDIIDLTLPERKRAVHAFRKARHEQNKPILLIQEIYNRLNQLSAIAEPQNH